MDRPADDIDLAVAASHAHGYVRALIAFTEQLQRTAPPGVHTAADTLAGWILDLDPDDERLRRAPRLLGDGQWRQLREDRALGEVVRRLASPAYAGQFAPVIGQLREALAAVCRIIGSWSRRHRPQELRGGPSIRGRTRCCWIWTGSCRRRNWSTMTRSSSCWTVATRRRMATLKLSFIRRSSGLSG